jgi:zinc and cadmium transporter
MLFLWIMAFSVVGSLGAISGAALLMVLPTSSRTALLPYLLSYATGTLLGAAFLGMIPTGLQQAPAMALSVTILAGIMLFFTLEKFLIMRHCHDQSCPIHGTAGTLILIGDALHNFIDGVVIASTFIVSIPLGLATSLAVIAHEVPQEIGDFAILLDSGFSKRRAFVYNYAASISTLPGALVGYLALGAAKQFVPYVLGVSAASFIYIAVADLVPGLHRKFGLRATITQLLLMLTGIATIAFFSVVR